MNIQKILNNPWIIGLLLLGVFLATNGYIYGWDDQHIEIPLLKKLIDPDLYPNDYYVDSLQTNFMSSLYPALSKLITTKEIPTAYFILYLISRYFLFFFMYKIWLLISRNRGIAILSVLTIIVLGRVEEFLYRTFSHQEFALAIIFAGIYFFYKERFLLAAAILGLAANFHALYSLFPMCYLGAYLLFNKKWRTLIKSSLGFLLFAAPFLVWAGKKYFAAHSVAGPPQTEWIALYQLACPQNFLFLHSDLGYVTKNLQHFWNGTGVYWFIIAVIILLSYFSPAFQKDKKTHTLLVTGGIFITLSFFFSYIYPLRFILDLNLIRNTQYMMFFLMGYLVIFLWELRGKNIRKYFGCLFMLAWMRFGYYPALLSIAVMHSILIFPDKKPREAKDWIRTGFSCILMATALFMLIKNFGAHTYSKTTWQTFLFCEILIFLCGIWCGLNAKSRKTITGLALVVPFIALIINFTIYHKRHYDIQRNGLGFWQLQRNWIDMQNYVREHTPKDALLLVPHDMEMGGFRIHSERSIVMSYRDCGIIGFDYPAAKEWKSRLDDISAFQVFITKPLQKAILSALTKYRVDYIVFMSYFKFPETERFKKIYENETFQLFYVNRTP